MSCFLVGNKVSVAKTEDVSTIEKEEKAKAVELSNKKVEVNETDEEKQSILNILYTYTADEILNRQYLLNYVLRLTIEESGILNRERFKISDEMKESQVNGFLKTYFADDIEIQNKIKQLPLNYQYVICKNFYSGKYAEQELRFLHTHTADEILKSNYFLNDVLGLTIEESGILNRERFKISDEMKESQVNGFLKTYFADDIEMQNKIKQLPLSYQYVIYEKLK